MIIRSKAPLRLGLAGGGTDVAPYCDIYGGAVLNATINMYSYCSIIPNSDGKIKFIASDLEEEFSCGSTKYIDVTGQLLIHKGVYNRIIKDFKIEEDLSFTMTTYSDAPPGSGLGSSSTMVVAIIKAYVEWLNLPLGEYDIAHLAYEIERIDLGLSGGKQDQYAATFGGFNYIEFYGEDRVIVNPLRIKNWIKNELESSIILYYTGKSRDSSNIIDEQIKNTLSKNHNSMEGMHDLKITAGEMKNAILMGDFERFSSCIREGWEAKKKLATSVTNSDIENTYDKIMHSGVKAAKISGAGGGGFMMLVCKPECRQDVMKLLSQESGEVRFVEFTDKGAQAWIIYE